MKNLLRFEYCIAGAAAAATFIVYLPALQNGFVYWDDNLYIYNNPHIRSFDMSFLKWAFSNHFYAENWHPLTWISHAIDYALWGLNPMGPHLTSILLHSINTFLAVVLIMRLLDAWEKRAVRNGTFLDNKAKLIAAGIAGLLFGIHPLHVESVAWAAERKDVLCALFFLLSILAYTAYASPITPNAGSPKSLPPGAEGRGTRSLKMYFLSLCFFMLAILSKPMAVSLPLVLLILDWHPFDRIRSFRTFMALFVEKLPFMVFSMTSSVLTVMAQKPAAAGLAPLPVRLSVAARSLVAYLGKILFPLGLVPFYPYPRNIAILSPGYFLPLALVAGIAAACLFIAKRQRLYLACCGYYVLTLAPVLGLVQVGRQSMADRYAYLPSLGPFLLAGLAAAWIWRKADALKKRARAVKAAIPAVFLLTAFSMSYLTVRQIGVWKNSFALWDYTIQKKPSDLAYYCRGSAYLETGQAGLALADFDKAIALNPDYADAYTNRGSTLAEMGQMQGALKDFSESILINPGDPEVYINRGNLYFLTGNRGLAIADFRKACGLGDEEGCTDLRNSGSNG